MSVAVQGDIAHDRAVVVSTLPQFMGGTFQRLQTRADRSALECDGWIFKFGRNPHAQESLRREADLLAFLRPRITMTLPQMVLHEGPEPFTQHRKIPGGALGSAQYGALDEGRRNALATRIAQFYAELHALPLGRLQAVGAVGAEPWMAPDDIADGATPRLPRGYKGFLNRTVAAYRKLSIAGPELVFGYFDGHGENMAFDMATGMLNGMFDFGDAGFGARHRDLSYSNAISADLTARVIDRYEALSCVPVDRQKVALYTSASRLAVLAGGEMAEAKSVADVVEWAEIAGR